MDFFSLVTFFLISLLTLYLFLHYFQTHKKSKGFKTYPIVASLPEFLKNRNRFLEWVTEVLRNSPTNTEFFQRSIGVRFIETANPENIEHILRTNFENYQKGDEFNSIVEDFLGHGIFSSDGELWKMQRKTASYEFSTNSLRSFVIRNVTVEIENRLVPFLEKASESGQVLDLQEVLERFAFNNICKLAFNFDPDCLGGEDKSGAEFMRAFENAAMLIFGRFLYAFRTLWKIKRFFNIGSERCLRESISTVNQLAYEIIRSRMESNHEDQKEDLLSRFIGTNNSPEFLRDVIVSFLLAGRDTTSSALTWFFWILSSRPDVVQNILTELEEIRSKNGRKVGHIYTYEELQDMHYLHAAISESMRLYPPVPLGNKLCLKDDILPDGTFVGKSWNVTYHIYVMGRIESIWGKNCLEYLPERWIVNGVCRQESPFKYPVFHAGPRMCLGKDMAFIQMKSVAANLFERFEIEVLNDKHRAHYLLSLTLRMKGGLPIRVRKKSL